MARTQRSLGQGDMTLPLISVVVPHYDDLTALDHCLDRLCEQSLATDQFEIVVADNMSPTGEASVAATIRGRARLIPAPSAGPGRRATPVSRRRRDRSWLLPIAIAARTPIGSRRAWQHWSDTIWSAAR